MRAYASYAYFGAPTRWAFSPKSDKEDEAVWRRITECAREIEKSVSLSEPESAVSRFNAAAAGETVSIDKTAYEILSLAKRAYEQTDGAYNPAVGIYIDLWGFSPRHTSVNYRPALPYDRTDYTAELPEEKYIRAFLPLTDFSAVELGETEGGYYCKKPQTAVEIDGTVYTTMLNLGGIAKGYCADRAEQIVRRAGYENGFLSLGTSSLVLWRDPHSGSSDGRWSVGANSPREELGAQYMDVYLKDTVLSSSGDSEQFYEIGGKRYCHIIDPFTGYPVNTKSDAGGIVCATVSGLSGAMGDAVTTALHVMGLEKAVAFARETLSDCGVSFVFLSDKGDYTLYTSLPASDYKLLSDRIAAVRL